jgi:hypothetical protein
MTAQTPVRQKLPVSVQSFKVIREQDFKYVDKTHKMYELAHSESNMIFLSRPRRFGKSMMLSTLEEYFKGNHKLFRGLAADQLEPPESEGGWKKHIVFHFDFAGGNFEHNGIRELHDQIDYTFNQVIGDYGLDTPKMHSYPAKFRSLIGQATNQSGLPIIILFDEYDQPLNQNLMNYEKLQPLRDEMRAFFSVLKTASEDIRFAMLTGVTKFSGVTLFSGVNQLFDISMENPYADICGITQTELEKNFQNEITALGNRNRLSYNDTVKKMQNRYDGYDFTGDKIKVYNPFSTIRVLSTQKFRDYWFASGTPSFLIKLVKEKHFDVAPIFNNSITLLEEQFENFTPESPDLISLLYQTGYITIKDASKNSFKLGFPNQEVKYGFTNSLTKYFGVNNRIKTNSLDYLATNIIDGNIEELIQRLQAYFAGIPYDLNNKTEKDFQTRFRDLFHLIGVQIEVEVHSAIGSADAIILADDFIYVFELKVKQPKQNGEKLAQSALQQIENRGYVQQYELDPNENRTIIKVGLVFDSETRTISDFAIDTLTEN